MNIYQINDSIKALIDPDTGEITDFDQLEQLELARGEKLKGAGFLIKENEFEIAARKAVIAAHKAAIADEEKRIGYRENAITRLKKYLMDNLGDNENIDTPEIKIKHKVNPEKFVIGKEDEDKLIEWLVTNNHDDIVKCGKPTIDKTAAKAAIKSGVEMPYGEVVRETVIKVD